MEVNTSYGKGTVQNLIDLNQFVRSNSYGDLGALKTTTQKFYRINGGSTQREGVLSDIVMPDRYSYIDMGERDIENAMPWDKIDEAGYKVSKTASFNDVIAKSKERMAANATFRLIDENAKWINERKDVNVYSLNFNKFKAEEDAIEAAAKKFKGISDYKNSLQFTSLPYEQEMFKKRYRSGPKTRKMARKSGQRHLCGRSLECVVGYENQCSYQQRQHQFEG